MDYYLGEYDNGQEAYLVTESIEYYEDVVHGCVDGHGYTCRVKAVYKNSNQYDNVYYKYREGQTVNLSRNGKWLFGLRTMHTMYDNPETNPEAHLCVYLRDKLKNETER